MLRGVLNSIKYVRLGFTLVLFVACLLLLPALSHAVTQSYKTNDASLLPGMVVSLDPDSTAENPLVRRAGLSDAKRLIGITTTLEDSLVTVSLADRPVYVATNGEVDVYVADTNGDIKSGDVLRLSRIKGVLERNPESDEVGVIIGSALADSNFEEAESFQVSSLQEVDAENVKVAKIRIALNSAALVAAGDTVEEKSGLAKLGLSITGKDIGEVRVFIALIIFIIVMVAEGGIIYGAISSAITSLGRNPLARKFIRNELIRVLLVAALVLIIGIAAIYAILFI